MKEYKATIVIRDDGTHTEQLEGDWNGRILASARKLLVQAYRHRRYEEIKPKPEEAKDVKGA